MNWSISILMASLTAIFSTFLQLRYIPSPQTAKKMMLGPLGKKFIQK